VCGDSNLNHESNEQELENFSLDVQVPATVYFVRCRATDAVFVRKLVVVE
jgi:hypothetical protein